MTPLIVIITCSHSAAFVLAFIVYFLRHTFIDGSIGCIVHIQILPIFTPLFGGLFILLLVEIVLQLRSVLASYMGGRLKPMKD